MVQMKIYRFREDDVMFFKLVDVTNKDVYAVNKEMIDKGYCQVVLFGSLILDFISKYDPGYFSKFVTDPGLLKYFDKEKYIDDLPCYIFINSGYFVHIVANGVIEANTISDVRSFYYELFENYLLQYFNDFVPEEIIEEPTKKVKEVKNKSILHRLRDYIFVDSVI